MNIILITGTSTGLGLKTAIAFAKRGDTVYATMRDPAKKTALEQEAEQEKVSLHILTLDVSTSESIEACVQEIIAREGRIDVLINNAGAGLLRASELATEKEIQQVMDINYLGVVRVTNAVLPHMRKQKAGHILNISSVGGLVGQPFNELYCAAKFAVEGYTEALATYITPFFGIHFTLVEPGGIITEFANSVFKDFSSAKKEGPSDYDPILAQYMAGFQSRSDAEKVRIYQSAQEVATLIVSAVLSPQPPLRMRTSDWSNEFCALKTGADPDGLKLQGKLAKLYFGK